MSKKRNKQSKTVRYRVLQDDIHPLVERTTELFRRLVSFCIEVIKEHPDILEAGNLHNQQSIVEKLVHKTKNNPNPPHDIDSISKNIPAYFRRNAINTAIGIAQSWYSNYRRWLNNGKKKRPPVLRPGNNQHPVYFKGMYKDFNKDTVMLKLYTGSSWVWRKVRISTTQKVPEGAKALSIKLVLKDGKSYIHRSFEKEKSRTCVTFPDRVVTVDLNLERTVVMAVVGRDGRVHKTKFISTRKDNRRRKFYLEAITRRLSITKTIPEGQSFCKERWKKIRHFNDNISHVLSRRIVDFAKDNGCRVIVFEHLGKLRPEKGSKSRYLNSRLMYWLKGDIYKKTSYKAQWDGIWTTRVSPKNTSKLCSRHHDIFNYLDINGTKRPSQSRFVCETCGYELDADLNACINIARKFYARDSQLKALGGDTQAWQEAIRFLSGCMNPLYSGLGKLGMDCGRDYVPISAPYPYPRQVEVLRIN